MVAAAFAIVAATVQAISVAWLDRNSYQSNTALSDNVQKKRESLEGLRKTIHMMLQDFKYWLVEGSLHELSKPPKISGEDIDAKSPAPKPHRTFKEAQLSSSTCDGCRKLAMRIEYQCTDCDQGYCANCWPRTQKRGARVEDTDGQLHHHIHPSIQTGNPSAYASDDSSPGISPAHMSTDNVPLRDIEEGRYLLLPEISPSLS